MKCRSNCVFKAIITVVLALIVVGIALASIFGFNNSVDYKDSYEVVVGVTQKIDEKSIAAKNAAENFFEAKGVAPVDYLSQTSNDASRFIYKFETKTEIDVNELKAEIEKAVNDASIGVIAEVSELKDVSNKADLGLVWVLSIAVVFGLVYLAISENFASGLSAIFTAITAGVLFVAMLGLTRLPAYPFLSLNLMVTFILTFVLSLVLARRFKEIAILNGQESIDKVDIICKASCISLKRFILFGIIGLIFSIALAVWGSYLTILGLQFVISIVCSFLVAYAFMPKFWLLLKKIK